jgi:hypothetical protein
MNTIHNLFHYFFTAAQYIILDLFSMSQLESSLPYVYDLPESTLMFISKSHQLTNVGKLFENAILLGIDTETKPSFRNYGNNKQHKTSLLQVSVRCSDGQEFVIIFDLLALASHATSSQELSDILVNVFRDEKVIKVGQNLDGDFQDLCRSYPRMQCFQRVAGILEVNALYRLLNPMEREIRSLKHFVQVYLHSNLVKSQQKSNWAARPLSRNQLLYAACDALVLLRLFDSMTCEIKEKIEQHNISALCLEYPDSMSTHYHGILKRSRETISSPSIETISDAISVAVDKKPSSKLPNTAVKPVVEDVVVASQSTVTEIKRTSSKKRARSSDSNEAASWQPLHQIFKSSTVAIGAVAERFVKAKRI